ncbi:MAG: HEAT repeat domain-containing protein [Phycisphaerae bacterium]|jgi:HEAT repeat protein
MMSHNRRSGFALILLAGLVGGCATAPEARIAPLKAFNDAKATMTRALDDSDPFTRSHAIEGFGDTIGAQAGEHYLRALHDGSPAVRFAGAMAVGDTRYAPAKDFLRKMADDKEVEPDRRVMPAVVYALYRLGDQTYAGDLYTLLFDPEKEVRANAALAMGKMGEPSAIGPLRTRLGDEQDPSVRLQVMESLAMLGDTASALSLEAYTKKTPYLDERLVAIPAMARVKSATAAQVLRELLGSNQPPRVRVAAAGALGMLGESNPQGYNFCLFAARDPEGLMRKIGGPDAAINNLEISSLQRLAAISLGWANNPDAVDTLHPLLTSGDSGVRVAAAMSIMRLLSGYQQSLAPAATAAPAPAVPRAAAERVIIPSRVVSAAPPSAPATQPAEPVAAPQPHPVLPSPATPAAPPTSVAPREKAAAPSATSTTRPAAKKLKLKTAGGKD